MRCGMGLFEKEGIMKHWYISDFTGEIQENLIDVIVEVFKSLWFHRRKWSLHDKVAYAVKWRVFEP